MKDPSRFSEFKTITPMRTLQYFYFACTFIAYFLFIPCALADDANFYNCKNGFYGCNTAQLTSDQQQVVKENALERNFYNCKNGFYGCNTAQLTSDQQQVVNSKTAPSQPSVGTACAENGSCYGDISDVTGAPKTTAVRGYYRRDGTYVRGHYRSRR